MVGADAEVESCLGFKEGVEITHVRKTSDYLVAIDTPLAADDGG